MFVCSDCSHMWKIRMMACGRCQGPLRPFGTEDADFDLPAVSRFPMRKVMHRTVPVRPGDRSTVPVWTEYAIRCGVDKAELEGKTKAQIMAMADEAGVAA